MNHQLHRARAEQRWIRDFDDVLRLLDGLFPSQADRWTETAADWWDRFYADRSRPVPFFVDKPDENLAALLERGLLDHGPRGGSARVLDLGCGPGRNSRHLAALGHEVDGVDLSPAALAWAAERSAGLARPPRFHQGDVFAVELPHEQYDLVYDSGCLHHLAPHRRISYLDLLRRRLAPGGHFALTCFASGRMGSELPDAEHYRQRSLGGGLAHTPAALRWIFAEFEEVEIRPMREQGPDSPLFGVAFLLTGLFRRRE
ncbi:class I SAM-dependent methyltransferase [Kitasatospora viridis]|uniref:Methyltransferase family protein n=1 Tax=Kitasatospora viridis TaxID=281105 RepID=A0A561UN38_9ACTN|nr:methyltransferase domain-containing protein [Kitasatospora viridis]TWG00779.1 methyltransferase family protein [Kitasatospora viridis]